MMRVSTFINIIIRRLNIFFHKKYFGIVSIVEILYLRLIGINLGRKCQFRGWVHVYLSKNSSITIGKKCTFNKYSFSNHIGLNHSCVLATHTRESNLSIGNNVGMSSSTINCWKSVIIGNNVRIGANCVIMDSDFHLDDPRSGVPKDIVIEDNVWLGANVTIMKGVRIGKNSIIGMGSIVTRDIPADCVAVGIPAKVIRKI